MTKKIFFSLILLSFTFAGFSQYETLEIGDKAPMVDYKMENIDGKTYTFSEVKDDNGTLVIFSCNTCPFVIAWEDRYPTVAAIAKKHNIGMILVNSNHMKRDGDDSKEAMKKHAKKYNYEWPYVIDDMSKLANAYGAMTTPHVYLFDSEDKLVYIGAIDDNYKDKSKVEEFYLKNAIMSLAKGEEIAQNSTRATGCSIKRP